MEMNGLIMNEMFYEKNNKEILYSSEIKTLLSKADRKLQKEEFEEAIDIYENILDEEINCAEAYVGILLGRYGLHDLTEIVEHDLRVDRDEVIIFQMGFWEAVRVASPEYARILEELVEEYKDNIKSE